jgi:hypothetical protein
VSCAREEVPAVAESTAVQSTAAPSTPTQSATAPATYVFDFSEGDKDQKDLLGGKGANLAEMVKLGLPVPPGFTISTEACRAYLASGAVPAGLDLEIAEHLAALEKQRGKRLGDRSGGSAAGVGAVGGEVLDAGDD